MNGIPDDLYHAVDRPVRILTAVAAYDGHDASILAINRSLRECGLPVEVIYMGYNKKVGDIVKAALEEGVDCVAVSSYNGGHNHFYPALVEELAKAGSPAIVVGGGGGTISAEDAACVESRGVRKMYGVEWSLDGLSRDVIRLAREVRETRGMGALLQGAAREDRGSIGQVITIAELLALMKEGKKTRSAGYRETRAALDGYISSVEAGEAGKEPGKEAGKEPGKEAGKEPGKETGKEPGTETAMHIPRTEDHPGNPQQQEGQGNSERQWGPGGKLVFVTGDGGAGKSTITDEIARRFGMDFGTSRRCAILSIDPTTVAAGAFTALLGDRIRMNNIYSGSVFMRSLATRVPYGNFPSPLETIISILRATGFDLIIVETPGTGQAGLDVHGYAPDATVYVKTREFGSVQVQLQKDQLIREADIVVLNKIDREGSQTVFRQIGDILSHSGSRRRVFATLAKLANDPGTNDLYVHLMDTIGIPSLRFTPSGSTAFDTVNYAGLVPHHRRNYLGRIVEAVREYDRWADRQIALARAGDTDALDPLCRQVLADWQDRWNGMTVERARRSCMDCELEYTSHNGIRIPKVAFPDPRDTVESLRFLLHEGLPGDFPFVSGVFPLRRETGMETTRQFAGLRLAEHTNERFHFLSKGVKNPRLSTAFDGITLYGDDSDTDPGSVGKIGEGGVSVDTLDDMKILYSGFDFREISTSMTINGPAPIILAMYFNVACDWMIEQFKRDNPDKVAGEWKARILGREGNESGKGCEGNEVVNGGEKRGNETGPTEQSGSQSLSNPPNLPDHPDLTDPPTLLNRPDLPDLPKPGELGPDDINPEYGIRQRYVEAIRDETYRLLRGTVQADILKEIQAQNECIFQSDFAIKLMGDVQQFFVEKGASKFYSISISGYHIGEAGATPIQEMAYTISNGFTYAENFMGRGMHIDEVAPNFSFFFRNSHEIEWLATGPVMRKIWAIALRDVYQANTRSQMFKFHTQTSGRALQIPEWDTLNPVRQTVHALIALLCNTNSLHVDSADEPLTTPGPKYVRQATMIPNFLTFEAEILRAQNLLSGSYAMREINRAVQDAVLAELERIDQEGGVGPATEVSYQRSSIAQASCEYEHDIFSGKRPIIGRNVLKLDSGDTVPPAELMRPTREDWDIQISRTRAFRERNREVAPLYLLRLREVALEGGNVFAELLTTVRYASLGQISEVLKEVGGRYSQQI